jgi:chemotaxis methyl-accepting protein methylase
MLGSDIPLDNEFVATVLNIVRERTGVDFSSYRPAMLERRIANRLSAAGAADRSDYLQRLLGSADESFRLVERITIKVSRFYRHAHTFDYLRDTILPELGRARAGVPLRIACVGCGAGEEPYTFAMLLEQAGLEGVIHAFDLDTSALDTAKAGRYPVSATAELPTALRDAWLEPIVIHGETRYRVPDNLRARVSFARGDITDSVPGIDYDLVSCRNVLIYLQRSAQARATGYLLEMIRDGGVLCLGEAEWPLPECLTQLEPLPHRTRLFRVRR